MSDLSPELEGRPIVEMSAVRCCCASHGEHLREQWPRGFAVVSVMLCMKAMERDPAVERGTLLEACGWKPGEQVPVGQINEITRRRPFCYFVERESIREAFMESGILTVGRCWGCRRSGLGGPYSVSLPKGPEKGWLCLECALDAGEREHRARPDGVLRA